LYFTFREGAAPSRAEKDRLFDEGKPHRSLNREWPDLSMGKTMDCKAGFFSRNPA
jgi:hypothetical protein